MSYNDHDLLVYQKKKLHLPKKNFISFQDPSWVFSLSEHFLLENRAYNKAKISSNGREAVANFEPSTFQKEINSESM